MLRIKSISFAYMYHLHDWILQILRHDILPIELFLFCDFKFDIYVPYLLKW